MNVIVRVNVTIDVHHQDLTDDMATVKQMKEHALTSVMNVMRRNYRIVNEPDIISLTIESTNTEEDE